jgi:hypothetical protein
MNTFIQSNNLKPGDVIVVPKSELNIVDHYVIYLGINEDGLHVFAENNNIYGVRFISYDQFYQENRTYKRIRRFVGSDYERNLAVNRAISLYGKPYHLTQFNCEDYANYVQYQKATSRQTNIGLGIAVLSIFALAGVFSKK